MHIVYIVIYWKQFPASVLSCCLLCLLLVLVLNAHIYLCTRTDIVEHFFASLFIIVNNWMQFKCLLIGKWMNKTQYIQSLEYSQQEKKKL